MEEIEPIPELPEGIKEAAEEKNLALFIGSGVSQICGCDSWEDLAKRLVNSCHIEGLIPYKVKDYLLRERNSKKVITICQNLCDASSQDIYIETLKEGLKRKKSSPLSNVYDYLYNKERLEGFGNIYLTTNIDTLFPIDSEHRLYQLNDFDPDRISLGKLYQLHGCVEDEDSLVFTVPEYIKRYTECDKYIDFLERIFKEYTVLFIGYGLDELEILQFMVPKVIHEGTYGDKQRHKRFILLPLYKGEENILKQEQSYFNAFGIEVIAYPKDEKGYEQLTNVIDQWRGKIKKHYEGEIKKHYEGEIKQDLSSSDLALVHDFKMIEGIVNEVSAN